jgi:hypothetical protein
MSENSHSEALWGILHQAGALLTEGGFAQACPPLPAGRHPGSAAAPSEGYNDLAARYGESLAFGTTWPSGFGSGAPLALILTEAPLSEHALAFVRTWFENPRVNLTVAEAFFVQPLPVLVGEPAPYQALARDLCTLLRPKALLSLGAAPAHRLLGAPLSLETLRGSDYRFDRWTMVTTLDPESYFSLAEDGQKAFKGQVWKDLQRLLGKLKYG